MPAAALGLKKYLGGTASSRTSASEQVDASAALGDSEVAAVQHSPGEVVKPELGQRREYDGEIPAAVAGKKSGYVLKEEPSPSGENSVSDTCILEEESAALTGEATSSAGDAEVLAGEATADEINGAALSSDGADVVVAGDVGPVLGEDAASPLVGLALPDDAMARLLESEVDSSDTREA